MRTRPVTLPQHRRRLTASILAATGLLVTGSAVGLSVVYAHDVQDDRVEQSAQLLLTLDELNESLRADTLQANTGRLPRADADIAELRSVLARADVSGLPTSLRDEMRSLLGAESTYADQVAAGLVGTEPAYLKHRSAALATLQPLTTSLDAMRGEVARAEAGSVAGTKQLERGVLVGILLLGALLGGLKVWAARRYMASVTRTLEELTATVTAVSHGDMSARTGIRQDDALGDLALVVDEMADSLGAAMAELRAGYAAEEGRGRFSRALEQTDTEAEVFHIVDRGLQALVPDGAARVLVADASEMHLTVVGSGTAATRSCDVAAPGACPAMRSARTVVTGSSTDLDACPRLRDQDGPAVSAVCTPVTFLGKALGVLSVIGQDGEQVPERSLVGLRDIAQKSGSRVGTMRALSQAQRQATVDPLTGLLNRRTLEDQARALSQTGSPYALAMLDLDHFKALNDTRGHEAGDRALKTFAQVLTRSLRDADVIGRYGGEEFVVILPGCSARDGLERLLAVRDALHETVQTTGVAFTFSAGITDSTQSDSWAGLLRLADAELMACKRAGRDRVAMAGTHDATARAS